MTKENTSFTIKVSEGAHVVINGFNSNDLPDGHTSINIEGNIKRPFTVYANDIKNTEEAKKLLDKLFEEIKTEEIEFKEIKEANDEDMEGVKHRVKEPAIAAGASESERRSQR